MSDMKSLYSEVKYYNELFTAKRYKKAAEKFCATYMPLFTGYIDGIDGEGDVIAAIDKAASDFVCDAKEALSKKGKIPSKRKIMPVNMFMVSYVIPGIIESGRDFSKEFAESVAKKWGETFNCNALGCTDFAAIGKGFNNTIFGIPVPGKSEE